MRYAHILATGRYVPERVLTNADVERVLGEPVDEWLRHNVGIEQRHVMADHEVTSDLCVHAAEQAMRRAGVTPEQVDLLVIATDTPDYLSPATASVVQAKLGARNAGTYDLNSACAGWVTALDVASKTIAADDSYQRVLVVGAYGMSRFVNWKDKRTCTLFADGAGAVVLGAGDTPGFLGAKLLAAGEYHDALGIYTGGTYRPATSETLALTQGRPAVQFLRKFPATFNTDRWPVLLQQLLGRARLGLDDVDVFIFTQLNLRTIEATMQALGQPMSKTHWTMDKWGYTGSACIPMTLDDAVEQGKVKKGDLVALCASGGGLAMASALYRWTA
ncbi:3-oxoacyl-ACP synthase III family protein [Cystobacter ferrugineus]|uniref:3-ketoacyl-ACP synthase n=1 Tax=Cystobacter ferrugineus TaxID=83449 RepID=A0A1L9BGZ2_9BACT|nr:ketoacyl-ACP synthase III [Cystobacter ferrugineus]OJH41533.1 3-ketoacyl-ACP synthase [Cystobacter ferrugineus]